MMLALRPPLCYISKRQHAKEGPGHLTKWSQIRVLRPPKDTDLRLLRIMSSRMSFSKLPIISDNLRETHLVAAAQDLNIDIEKLGSEIFNAVMKLGFNLRRPCLLSMETISCDDEGTLFGIFMHPILSETQRLRVVEAMLCDHVCSVVYEHYFKGPYFMGVGSTYVQEKLDMMLKILRKECK